MIIAAVDTPLEVLLAIQVFDNDGNVIPRVVYLDTETLEAKQLVLIGDKLVCRNAQSSRYCFAAQTTGIADSLRSFLPKELHDRIVTATSKDSE